MPTIGADPDGWDPVAWDRSDPLAGVVTRFEARPGLVAYLDGNSLGPAAITASTAARDAIERWTDRQVLGWDDWIDRPLEVGDLLAPIVGSRPGEVLVGESTTIRLHQAVHAALASRPDRRRIVAVTDDFPTDRYVLEEAAARHGRVIDAVPHDGEALIGAIGTDTAVVVASVVDFVTGNLLDIGAITATAHAAGALVVWDCSHAAGAVPLDLADHDVDLAVGCTYKYLHGGPGAPAWIHVATRHHGTLRPPIPGWFAQRDQFAMGADYDPRPDIGGWQTGTPGILGLDVARTGIAVVADAGIEAVRAKSRLFGQLMVAAADAWFAPLGLTLASPRDPDRRGGHVSMRHPDASRMVRAGRDAGVIADHRPPDVVRMGPSPLACTFAELVAGLSTLRDVIERGDHLALDDDPGRVT